MYLRPAFVACEHLLQVFAELSAVTFDGLSGFSTGKLVSKYHPSALVHNKHIVNNAEAWKLSHKNVITAHNVSSNGIHMQYCSLGLYSTI